VLVGAYSNDDGDSGGGKTYLLLGSNLSGASMDLSSADYTLIGENTYEVYQTL